MQPGMVERAWNLKARRFQDGENPELCYKARVLLDKKRVGSMG